MLPRHGHQNDCLRLFCTPQLGTGCPSPAQYCKATLLPGAQAVYIDEVQPSYCNNTSNFGLTERMAAQLHPVPLMLPTSYKGDYTLTFQVDIGRWHVTWALHAGFSCGSCALAFHVGAACWIFMWALHAGISRGCCTDILAGRTVVGLGSGPYTGGRRRGTARLAGANSGCYSASIVTMFASSAA